MLQGGRQHHFTRTRPLTEARGDIQERATLEGQLDQTDKASTETLRIALQRYRSFFERLPSF